MDWSSVRLTFLLIFVGAAAMAEVNRYMVFFRDKTGTIYSTALPNEFLSQRAIDRRIQQGILITDQDFPVNASYVQGISGVGAEVFYTTRWMNGVLVQCDAALVAAIENLPFVERVEFVAPNEKLLS
ncbi:MAG: peptidase S8/S53 subtilisin kexin sedolisin, partial [Cyclobacteriaceae bacterium]|nr:peptidase S8/S53 subtilisin kexin sedolisin [Cyclobacteriaceae bacterium]